jgi:hypothetical protein
MAYTAAISYSGTEDDRGQGKSRIVQGKRRTVLVNQVSGK